MLYHCEVKQPLSILLGAWSQSPSAISRETHLLLAGAVYGMQEHLRRKRHSAFCFQRSLQPCLINMPSKERLLQHASPSAQAVLPSRSLFRPSLCRLA